MKNVKVLDVTLRDGGCVNEFNFNNSTTVDIISSLENSNIDIIELGYIDEKNGSFFDRTMFNSVEIIKKNVLTKKKYGTLYVVMIDYGKYNIEKLPLNTDDTIDAIRLSFHKKDSYQAIDAAIKIKEKGYNVFLQPMLTLRYTEEELLTLIGKVNDTFDDILGFYIVDSFGEMRNDDIIRISNLIHEHLSPQIPIGLHSHNNLQLSYSNATTLLEQLMDREIILDSSIMGMGKGAGNLNTELLLEHLNIYYNKNYQSPALLKIMDSIIKPLHDQYLWGYSVEYYLSSIHSCTPSYASHYYNKHILSIEQLSELLSMIAENKKISFDKNYAEELYRQYNSKQVIDDQDAINYMTEKLHNKKVILIAPGKTIATLSEELYQLSNNEDIVCIGINLDEKFQFNYSFITRQDVYYQTINVAKCPIISSNISFNENKKGILIDYSRWIEIDEETHDSSAVIALNFLISCGITTFTLYGFDGFTHDIEKNYYDVRAQYAFTNEEIEKKNAYNEKFYSKLRKKGISMEFSTPSIYDDR